MERCFNRLKQFRTMPTRYTKRTAYYRTGLPRVWLTPEL
jgi:hypothetical protein